MADEEKLVLFSNQVFMSECTALLRWKLGFGGFQTVASAHVLHQPTIVGPSISRKQCPPVWNFNGTEHSLNRSECRVKSKAAKIISNKRNSDMEVGYFQYMGIRNQKVFPNRRELDYRSQNGCQKWPEVEVDNENNSQSRYCEQFL